MRYMIPLFALCVCTACGSARKQLERASAYERGGMLNEAYTEYADLYTRKPREVEARIGMKRAAQSIFDRKQSEASSAYAMQDLDAGDRARAEATAYRTKMNGLGLDLQWDPLLDMKRKEAVRNEVDRLYAAARTAYAEDRFADAQDLAYRCTRLDPDRREAINLQKLAQVEPIYREALRAQELGLWREAYRKYDQVSKLDPGYKECLARLAACKERAAYTLAYVPLYNPLLYPEALGLQTLQGQIEAQFAANVKQEVLGLNDPLIVMVDRDNTGELLAEQQRQMSGVYDDRYVAAAGKLLGARYVLTGRIQRFDDVLRKEIEVQVQLIDAESGRIHMAEIVRVNKQEIGRGAPRAQLLERAAKRAAQQLASFDPVAR